MRLYAIVPNIYIAESLDRHELYSEAVIASEAFLRSCLPELFRVAMLRPSLMLPWVSPAKQYWHVVSRSVEQEEPHRCSETCRGEAVERTGGVNVNGVGAVSCHCVWYLSASGAALFAGPH